MIKLGYALSSEEHKPNQLVAYARMAESAGFKFLMISDHFHPWVSQQGQSSFVWSVLGGIAQTTQRVSVRIGVTCPIMRIHPSIVAQAAATVADMMPGRFFLGLGTGEYLNEHILGYPWPRVETCQEILAEAIYIIRELWKGEELSFEGNYFMVREELILDDSGLFACANSIGKTLSCIATSPIVTEEGNDIVTVWVSKNTL